jgi:hypothetical protein
LASRWRYRENIGYIYGLEMTLSGCSTTLNERLHFHFILLSHAPLSAEVIQERWIALFGQAKCEFYDNSKNGVGYILKKIDQEQCEWNVSDNLYLFVPHYQPKTKHERRALERQKMRNSLREGPDTSSPEQKQRQQSIAFLTKQRSTAQAESGRKYSFEELFKPPAKSVVSQLTEDAVKQANSLLRTQGKQAMDEYLKNAPCKLLTDPRKKIKLKMKNSENCRKVGALALQQMGKTLCENCRPGD